MSGEEASSSDAGSGSGGAAIQYDYSSNTSKHERSAKHNSTPPSCSFSHLHFMHLLLIFHEISLKKTLQNRLSGDVRIISSGMLLSFPEYKIRIHSVSFGRCVSPRCILDGFE